MEDIQRTTVFPPDSEFCSVYRGESVSIIQELPDGTVVIRREETGEEGLVPRIVFEIDDDLRSVGESELFDD